MNLRSRLASARNSRHRSWNAGTRDSKPTMPSLPISCDTGIRPTFLQTLNCEAGSHRTRIPTLSGTGSVDSSTTHLSNCGRCMATRHCLLAATRFLGSPDFVFPSTPPPLVEHAGGSLRPRLCQRLSLRCSPEIPSSCSAERSSRRLLWTTCSGGLEDADTVTLLCEPLLVYLCDHLDLRPAPIRPATGSAGRDRSPNQCLCAYRRHRANHGFHSGRGCCVRGNSNRGCRVALRPAGACGPFAGVVRTRTDSEGAAPCSQQFCRPTAPAGPGYTQHPGDGGHAADGRERLRGGRESAADCHLAYRLRRLHVCQELGVGTGSAPLLRPLRLPLLLRSADSKTQLLTVQ